MHSHKLLHLLKSFACSRSGSCVSLVARSSYYKILQDVLKFDLCANVACMNEFTFLWGMTITHETARQFPQFLHRKKLSLPWTSHQLCNFKAVLFPLNSFDQLAQFAYWDCLVTAPFCASFHLIYSTSFSTLLVGVCKSVLEAFNFKQQELKEASFRKCVYPSVFTLKNIVSLSFPIQEFITSFHSCWADPEYLATGSYPTFCYLESWHVLENICPERYWFWVAWKCLLKFLHKLLSHYMIWSRVPIAKTFLAS